MLSIAVCDDEIRECCHISRQIQTILDKMNIPGTIKQYHSSRELLHAPEEFDIIFLDIIMQGSDGMKTAELFRRKSFDKLLIFITSSRQYVFDAFSVEAFEYLLKPIDDKKLANVLQRAAAKLQQYTGDYIIVNKARHIQKLYLDDIRYFEIRGRLIEAHGKNGVFSWYEQISALETSLQGKGFFRCHKSFLINLNHVDVYHRQEAVLDNGESIMIAKRRYEAFRSAILDHMRKNGGITTS